MVNNIIKRLQNIMRQDAGISGDAQRIEQMVWMFFLKVYDTQEETWEYKAYKDGKTFKSIIPEKYRWRNWAIDGKDGKALTGEALLHYINEELFPTLKSLPVTRETPRSKSVVREVFADLNQYMKNGVLLRQVINVINEIEFDDAEDRHMFGDIYEGILKDLQSAGNAGEFYTPRALTDFIIEILNPQLGETVGDFTSGTGGFLTSALNHLAKQVKTTDDGRKFQNAVIGQEWKPLPYLLSITNLLLHDVESPNIRNCDSLGTRLSDFTKADKVDVIAMNPPYGGSTEASAKSNFPMEFRSSETADLFMVLIMKRLKENGRAGVIIPDGFLFGAEGAKLAIKTALLRNFNLHTIIRLPGSIFAPYTTINTNIVFFNNEAAEGAEEGFKTKDVWFYRLDMPEGYKHFSKTKPMRLDHCQPIRDWWNNRTELITTDEEGNVIDEKARRFTAQQLIELSCNFDQCKFPKSEEEVLPLTELLADYHERREALDRQIDNMLQGIELSLKGEKVTVHHVSAKAFYELAELQKSFPARLRQSILQEAIQGKLVPQDENEEAASFLLERLETEKKTLVDNKILKKSELDTFELKEQPDNIPTGWRFVKLRKICTLLDGEKKSGKYTCMDAKFLRGKSQGVYLEQGKFVRKGENIILVDGENSGEVFVTPIDGYMGSTFKQLWISKEMHIPYVIYLIKSFKETLRNDKKGSAIPHLKKELFFNLPVGIPPLAEQQRIVAKIEELFAQIDKISK